MWAFSFSLQNGKFNRAKLGLITIAKLDNWAIDSAEEDYNELGSDDRSAWGLWYTIVQ